MLGSGDSILVLMHVYLVLTIIILTTHDVYATKLGVWPASVLWKIMDVSI